MALQSGTRLGPYVIGSPIGAGGMGEVYRATDSRLGRQIALKVLPKEFSRDETLRSRFVQEARAAGALNHPNVVSIYDVGQSEDIFYIVSELVDGDSLRQMVARGPIAPNKIVDLATQISEGLAAAHAAGIVHRDLKPENILVTRNGLVKIIDFGIARQVLASAAQSAEGSHTLTLPGTVMGTVGYMSPEQICGQVADARTDIFSLGIILFEMATGRTVFTGATVPEVVSATLKDDPPELQVEGLPPGLALIIRRCLDKNPQGRFQTASDLAFAIRNLTAIPAVPVTAPVARPEKKSRVWIGWTAAAVVVLAAVGGGWFLMSPRAKQAPTATAAQPQAPVAAPVSPLSPPPAPAVVKPAPGPSAPPSKSPVSKAPALKPPEPATPPPQPDDGAQMTAGNGRFANLFGRAQQANDDGDYAAAIGLFTSAIGLKPDAPMAYVGRSRAYLHQQKFDQALHDLDEAIRLKPGLAAAYIERGRVRNQTGDYKRAIEDFDQALRLKPDAANAYQGRALAKSKTGDNAGAAADRRQAAQLAK